jgi:hypothetical protein
MLEQHLLRTGALHEAVFRRRVLAGRKEPELGGLHDMPGLRRGAQARERHRQMRVDRLGRGI